MVEIDSSLAFALAISAALARGLGEGSVNSSVEQLLSERYSSDEEIGFPLFEIGV